jgi:hypothetical protein
VLSDFVSAGTATKSFFSRFLTFSFFQTIMEILGIVWAASIINPTPSIATAATDMVGRRPQQQQPTPIKETASWFTSLAYAYGWASPQLEATAAFSSYASSMSWLVPNLGQIELTPDNISSSDDQFSAIVPLIGTGLAELNSSLMAAPDTPEGETVVAPGQWHQWNAVAAVRLEETPHPPNAESIAPVNWQDDYCVAGNQTEVPYQASTIAMVASPKLQVWVHDQFIGEVAGRTAAQKIAQKLRTLIQEGEWEANQLHPLIGSNFVGVSHRNDILFIVDETMRSHPEMPATAIAVQWINNLRLAFGAEPLDLAQVQLATQGLAETGTTLYGTASWYGPGFHGRKTANGERYNQYDLTAAHKKLPFNTYLKVTNRLNGKSVVVRINDRGPYIGNRTLDLSKAAAQCLGSTSRGVIPYEAVILEKMPKPDLDELTTASSKID